MLLKNNAGYVCNNCNTCYSTKIALMKHLKKPCSKGVMPANHKKCSDYDKVFIKTSSLEGHLRFVHKKTSQEITECLRTKYECSVCDEAFTERYLYKNHVKSVHEEKKKFECNICDSKLTSKQSLQFHIDSVHEGKKPYLCSHCGFTASQSNNLKTHISIVHEKKRPYVCDICEKSFQMKFHVIDHKLQVSVSWGIESYL